MFPKGRLLSQIKKFMMKEAHLRECSLREQPWMVLGHNGVTEVELDPDAPAEIAAEYEYLLTLIRRVSMLEILSSRRTSYRRTLQQRAQGCAMRIRKIMSRAGASGVTVFDWDDTLFPTFVICSRSAEMTMELWNELQELARVVEELLKCCLQVGTVVIVTNSEEGWVEYSAHTYFPSLTKVLRQCRIISARTTYEKQYPEDQYADTSSLWKLLAFALLWIEFKPSQLISIGDSVKERQACLKAAAASTYHCLPKSVKLVSAPSCKTLIRELTILREAFQDLFMFNSPVDVSFDGEHWQLQSDYSGAL
ncbi:apicomplexan-conserved protein, putative [Perkinsus marinus ATCC 50983]|uniref:Apicomplexan-conserved protein, putative n=1 Tax=Perkinsus marinus (strain ATCC 50983 / TXsc) TaxID=423536 RepID=C5KGG6_PERM5|nr:apicomplexan-conserved protein, putative [Perkinsus marinus ATCC 50983]EER16522.1 apicomplexan-conserved protein, putative [Perkinsus marinus ATCC 50983]|eukprot:XP_002784726.1 apicomplexan-conserved protein, putative [Perkinsus marinus ATCC 50983]